MKKQKASNLCLLLIGTIFICFSCVVAEEIPEPSLSEFGNPETVTILDYHGHAMEPALSRNGKYLFFNNLNDVNVNTNLHWALYLSDLTFQYIGEINGVNTSALEGVPSINNADVFYFVSTRSYYETYSTIYKGHFNAGTISNIELVTGFSIPSAGTLNFDAEISPDGTYLYFVTSEFSASGPITADIQIAETNGNSFSLLNNSAALMAQINTDKLEYAPAVSASGLELFFTRVTDNNPKIFRAVRLSMNVPFNKPKKINAISGFSEAPTLSKDEKYLYYHHNENGIFIIKRVSRQ